MSIELQFGDTVVRALPVAGAAGVEAASRFLGMTLSEWFYIAAIGYTVIQSWAVIYKTLKKNKEAKHE